MRSSAMVARVMRKVSDTPAHSPYTVLHRYLQLLHLHIVESGFADARLGGWRGILYANLALIDPKASYAFFRDGTQGHWDELWIDGGASRTWYLVFAAALAENARR